MGLLDLFSNALSGAGNAIGGAAGGLASLFDQSQPQQGGLSAMFGAGAPGSSGGALGNYLNDYFRALVPYRQPSPGQQYPGLMSATFGQFDPGQIQATPRVTSPEQVAGNSNAGLYDPLANSGAGYAGGLLSGPSAIPLASAFSKVDPSVGAPLLQSALGDATKNAMMQARLAPFLKQGAGTPAGGGIDPKQIALATGNLDEYLKLAAPEYQEGEGINPATGQLETYQFDKKNPGQKTWLGINPGTDTTLSPDELAKLGVTPGMIPPGSIVTKSPKGAFSVTKVGDLVSPAAVNQKGEIASVEETAKQKAQTGALIPANDPVVQSHVTNILNGNETEPNVPGPLKNSVSLAMANTPTTSYSPLAQTRFTNASNRITQNFIQLPQYQLTANGLPYLQRIDAAMKTPGSVSDEDLLDSIVKLNTSGNAITDAQVRVITDGQSYKDAYNVWANKLKNGGVLSPNQRGQIQQIAKAVYANYQKGYQPVFDQVTKQYDEAGIPKAFRTMPDLNSLAAQGGLARPGSAAPAGWKIEKVNP